MLRRGAQARSARRLWLVLGTVYALVLASPELAVGTVVRPVARSGGTQSAHFAPWRTPPSHPAGTLRSPRDRRAAPRAEPTTAHDGALGLRRPTDPLTRLVHAHVAQYGGDLDALTHMDLPGAPSVAAPEK